MLNKDVSIRRLRGLRSFIKSIPHQLFNLDDTGTYAIARDIKRHGGIKRVFAKPTQALECGSVGCIGGWGCSMPAYNAWASKRGLGQQSRLHWSNLTEYLFGITGDYSPQLFDGAREEHADGKGHKAEALKRITDTIEMAKAGEMDSV